MVNGIRRMGGFHAGLMMASLLGAGLVAAEPPRRRVLVTDDEAANEGDETRQEPLIKRVTAGNAQPSPQAQRALSQAEEKRARKNARRRRPA